MLCTVDAITGRTFLLDPELRVLRTTSPRTFSITAPAVERFLLKLTLSQVGIGDELGWKGKDHRAAA